MTPAIGFGMGERGPELKKAGVDARYDAVARLEVERWQDTVGPRVTLEALVRLPAGPGVPGGCAIPCDVTCGNRLGIHAVQALVQSPFAMVPVGEPSGPPVAVCDRRGEERVLPLLVGLAGADGGVVAVVADVPRRRAALGDVLAPGRLGVEVAVIGGDRCDRGALRARLALARGGPMLALLDYRGVGDVDLPADVHVVVVDPPASDADMAALRHAGAGRCVHLAWGEVEVAHARRVAEDDLSVREVARTLWPTLTAGGDAWAWDAGLDGLLAGDGPIVRSPRAVAAALAALRDAGLLEVGEDGIRVLAPQGQADLDSTPTGLRAAVLRDQARMLLDRAMTVDLFLDAPRPARAVS